MKKKFFISIILLNSFIFQSNAMWGLWFGEEKNQKPQEIHQLKIEKNQQIQEISAEIKDAVTSGLQKLNDDLKNEYQQILLKTIRKIAEQIENQTQNICDANENKKKIEYLITYEISKTLNESTAKYKDEISTPGYLAWLTDLIVSKFKEVSESSTGEGVTKESEINFTEIKDKVSNVVSQKFVELISKTGNIINQKNTNELEQITNEIITTLDNILTPIGEILAEVVKKITHKFVDSKLYDLAGSGIYRGTVASFAGNMASNKIIEYTSLIINSIKENSEKIKLAIAPNIENIKDRLEGKKVSKKSSKKAQQTRAIEKPKRRPRILK